MYYILVFLFGLLGGYLGNKIKRIKTDKEYQKNEYAIGITAIKEGNWYLALWHLFLSIGRLPSFEAYNSLGIVWSRLKRWDCAAEAFRCARHLAGYGLDKIPYPEEVCELFNKEAEAHARGSQWEFAYIRSREALYLIREGQLPRYVEYGDCESWLRLVRMVAAVKYLKMEEAVTSAQEDANWILAKSRVSGYKKLANIVLINLNDFSTMQQLLIHEWKDYDKSIRSRPPIVIDP